MVKATKSSGKKSKSGVFGKLVKNFLPNKLTKQQRSIVLAGTLSLVLVVTALFALAFNKSTELAPKEDDVSSEIVDIETAPEMKATITLSSGVVEYRTDGAWDKVTQEMKVLAGMMIKTTGAASRAVIDLEDGSSVRVDANTELRLETLTAARVVIVQESGHIYNRITPSETRTYVVQTENAQFQSLGTAFRTNKTGDEESVEVFHSAVRETTGNSRAAEGEKLTVKNFADPNKDGSIEGIDIEQLKEDSFITWNRDLDQQNEAFKDSLGFLSDFDGPAITISEPSSGSNIEVDSGATSGNVVIGGNTERRAKLTVQSKSQPGSTPVEVSLDGSGNFQTPNLEAPLGTSVFEFVATDTVGNKTVLNVTYVFNKKTVVQEQGIALTIDTSESSSLLFEWGLVGMSTPDGVQLVYDTKKNPKYPSDKEFITEGNQLGVQTSKFKADPGDTLYFRICRYDEDTDSCDIYSNQVSYEVL